MNKNTLYKKNTSKKRNSNRRNSNRRKLSKRTSKKRSLRRRNSNRRTSNRRTSKKRSLRRRKLSRRKLSRKKAGKYVAEGTYGCVYYPKINTVETETCPDTMNEDEYKKLHVSKIMTFKNANDELKLSKIIKKKIPKWEENFILPIQLCLINKEKTNDERNEWYDCRNQNVSNSNILTTMTDPDKEEKYVSLQMKNALSDLNLIFDDIDKLQVILSLPFDDLLKSMIPLFEGIVKMTDQKLIHQDIKLDNILYQSEEKKMYFIDIGILSSFDQFFEFKGTRNFYYHDYNIWPLDRFLGMEIYNETIVERFFSENTNFNTFRDNINRYFFLKGTYKYLLKNVHFSTYEENTPLNRINKQWTKERYPGFGMFPNIDNLFTFNKLKDYLTVLYNNEKREYQKYLEYYKSNFEAYKEDSKTRLDLFSLGKTLSEFVSKLLNYIDTRNDFYQEISTTSGFDKNEKVGKAISVEEEYNSRYGQFFRLMYVFTEQIPLRRPTAKIALSMFKKFVDNNFQGAMKEYKQYLENIPKVGNDSDIIFIPGDTVENAIGTSSNENVQNAQRENYIKLCCE